MSKNVIAEVTKESPGLVNDILDVRYAEMQKQAKKEAQERRKKQRTVKARKAKAAHVSQPTKEWLETRFADERLKVVRCAHVVYHQARRSGEHCTSVNLAKKLVREILGATDGSKYQCKVGEALCFP